MTAPPTYTTLDERRAAAVAAALVADPVAYSTVLLGQTPWEVPQRILRALLTHRRVAVKACHASAKTHTAAQAVLWWPVRYRDGIVITTAPTWSQVKKVMWAEVRDQAAGSRIAFPTLNETELRLDEKNFAIGISTNEGTRFQGWHGRHILIIVDEAPGVLAQIFEAIEGVRAGGNVTVLMLGNPTIVGGTFYEAFNSQRASWLPLTISAFDTPNLRGCCLYDPRFDYFVGDPDGINLLRASADVLDIAPRPYLITRRWVLESYLAWGRDNPMWESRVLGQFPSQAESALVPLAWIERAERAPAAYDPRRPVRVGVDVAGQGENETAAEVVQDGATIASGAWPDKDPRGRLAAFLAPFAGNIETMNVDSDGPGYYFAQHFADLGFPVRYVRGGIPKDWGAFPGALDPRGKPLFANARAYTYWNLRQLAQAGAVAGWTDATTNAQLAAIRWRQNARGLIEVETKDEMKARGAVSPDRAEARMYALLPPEALTPAPTVVTLPDTMVYSTVRR